MSKLVFVLCLGLFYMSAVLAQQKQTTRSQIIKNTRTSPDIIFYHLNEKDGLSYNIVSDLIQDKDGILWISTTFGLNRYDGFRFNVFKMDKSDPKSIIHNGITSICTDMDDNIWGGTGDGIFCYNKKKGYFINYYTKDSLKYPQINAIASDKKNRIWAGGDFGLIKLNQSKAIFEYLEFDIRDKNTISHNFIHKKGIARTSNGEGLWVATAKGLNLFDFKTEKFTNYRNHDDSLIFNDHPISALHMTNDGILWFLDDKTDEIKGLQEESHKILYKIPVSKYIKDAEGGTLFETSNHELWYSSSTYETIRIDYLNNFQIEIVKNNISDPGSISGDFISSAWEDKDKTVWLGTYNGISKFNNDRSFYKTHRLSVIYPELDENWQITCIVQNPENQDWWIGTRKGKAYVYNSHENTTKVIDFVSFKNHNLKSSFITDIDFVGGKALICYSNDYLFQYDLHTGDYRRFNGLTDNFKYLKIQTLSQESDSTYLLSNNMNMVLRWNTKSNTFEHIKFRTTQADHGQKFKIGWLKSSMGKGAWLATDNHSLGYIHPGSPFIEFIEVEIGMKKLRGGFFNSMEVDSNGNAWFAYLSQGIYQAKKKVPHVRSAEDVELLSWDSSDGLVNDNLSSTVPDKNGMIWLGALNKLSVFDTNKSTISNFKINLSENNLFFYNYMIPLVNGHMLMNIKGDLIEFFPEKLGSPIPKNSPFISNIQLPNRKIYISEETNITLKPDENFLTIGFGCLSDIDMYRYHFEHKLEGINKTWVKTSKNAEATFSDLAPGTYSFKVIAKTNNGLWQSEEKNLNITIMAPFYKTWWFRLVVSSALGLFMFFSLRDRIRNIRNLNELKSKAQLLEKEKTVVMYENLKQHLNPHFLFNSLTSLSSLIRIDQRQASDFLDKMSKVYRYILKNKDNETVPLIEELKFVEMYNKLQQTRFGDGLKILVTISDDYHYRKIAPVTLQNLVENAIKHNVADVESPLVIRLYVDNDYLVVQNNIQVKGFVETSNKQGQHSMISLYRFLSPRPVVITQDEDFYTVKIPLI